MASPSNPSEIARETLKQLATRRIPPTPDNYGKVYQQIAGVQDSAADAFPERQVKALLAALPSVTAAQDRLLGQINRRSNKELGGCGQALTDFASGDRSTEWRDLLPTLIRHGHPARRADAGTQAGIVRTRHGQVPRIRINAAVASESLVKSCPRRRSPAPRIWPPTSSPRPLAQQRPTAVSTAAAPALASLAWPDDLRELLAFTLDSVVHHATR